MQTIHTQNYKQWFVGSAFFACGGGVPYQDSVLLMNSLGENNQTNLVSYAELDADDDLCTVYAIGASGAAKKHYQSFIFAIKQLEKYMDSKIKGIIPGEIGSEVNVVWVANQMNLPVVDSDMVGGRSVPEEQMDLYGIYEKEIAPVVVVNDQGDKIIIDKSGDLSIMESVYRSFAVASGGYCYVAGRFIKQNEAKKFLPEGTVSRAIRVGEILLDTHSEKTLLPILQEEFNSNLLVKGVILTIELHDVPGFLAGEITIKGHSTYENKTFKLSYKNEHILLTEGDEYVCSVPDLISVIDAKSFRPIANKNIKKGMEVLIIGTPSLPVWQLKKAISLFNPKCFGYNYNYKPMIKNTGIL